MSTGAVGYDPIGYHTGTVWPHDTAMAAIGLAAIGHRAEALALLDALLDAAAHVGWRLPEVLTGHPRADTRLPIVYPTSSSPQAWAAAAPVGALVAILGLTPDPDSRSIIAPHPVPRDLDLALSGVPAFGRGWDVVAAHGRVRVTPAAPT
jgi:glycogen debranching enzyme